MAYARHLYHTHPDWGHSVAGYVTDYVIFGVAVACAIPCGVMYLKEQRGYAKRLLMSFLVYALFAGVSYLFGGIAHHLIDSYGDEVLGLTWKSDRTSWLYFWTVAVTLAPPGVCACPALVFAFMKFPLWSQFIAYALGGLLGFVELVVAITERLAGSGSATAYTALLLMVLSAVGVGVLALMKMKSLGSMAFKGPAMQRLVGRAMLMVGLLLTWIGYLIVAFKPESCARDASADLDHLEMKGECPYSEDFNQNAIFHCFVIAGMIAMFFGVLYAVRGLEEP